MKKRTAKRRIRVASRREGHIDAAAASRRVGIRVSESYCVSSTSFPARELEMQIKSGELIVMPPTGGETG